MCGRYASTASPTQLAEEFEVDDVFDDLPGPDYNVAPTVAVPAVFERLVKRPGPVSSSGPVSSLGSVNSSGPVSSLGSGESGEVRRRLAPLVWGLVPSWAKDAGIGARMINARVETVAEKSAYAKAFRARRCLLPADGFYEWHTSDPPSPTAGRRSAKPRKQPFFLHRADGGRLVMAGIYEIWRDPRLDRDDDSAWLRTCSVITTRASDAAGHIHDRMPMVIPREAIDAWLDPRLTDPEQALALLSVTEAAALTAYPVSTLVNSVQNNEPALLEPLAEDDPEPLEADSGPGVPPGQERLL